MMTPAKFIRKQVFRLNQTDFAAHLGVVQSSVARWDRKGFIPPKFHDRVRALAAKSRIKWQNVWLVEVPNEDRQSDQSEAPHEKNALTAPFRDEFQNEREAV